MFKQRKGQSLVETALILPVILLILTGIIDFGLLFNNYIIIANASREVARQVVVGKTDIQINTVFDNMTSTLDKTKLNISISPSYSNRHRDDEITVTVTFSHSLITPIIQNLIPNPFNLESKTVMRME